MSSFTIVGFWKFRSNRIREADDTWFEEKLSGGTMAFSSQGDVLLFVRSAEQGPWGYSGKYTLKDGQVLIEIETSTAEGLDGQIIDRSVTVLSPNEFILSGNEAHTGRKFETQMIRVA